METVKNLGKQNHVRSRKDAEADHVHVFLKSGFDDHLRRLANACVDDLHACVAKGASDDLGPSIMSVQSGFCDQHSHYVVAHIRLSPGRVLVHKLDENTASGARMDESDHAR